MLATGWYSQRLLSRGVSSRLARGILGGLSVVLGGAALAMLPYVPGTPVKIALTTLGVALPSAIHVISNAVVGEITPAAQRGALLAIGTAAASSAGLLAPYIMGGVIESATTPLDGFNTGFFICGVIMLVGGAIAMALVDPEREAKRRSLRQRSRPLSARHRMGAVNVRFATQLASLSCWPRTTAVGQSRHSEGTPTTSGLPR
jgi:MFS family permease